MVRRPALLVLLAVLALLAPLAVVADSCGDCLWGASQGCCPCPISCCPCCVHGSSILTVAVRMDLGPASTELTADPAVDLRLSADPRGVFHVPKSLLA